MAVGGGILEDARVVGMVSRNAGVGVWWVVVGAGFLVVVVVDMGGFVVGI